MLYNNNMFNLQTKTLNKEFLNIYFSFLDFLKNLIHNNDKLIMFNRFYKKNIMMRKANPSFFIKKWYSSISVNYHEQILNNNVDFFINKNDYQNDIKQNFNEHIEDLNKMSFEDKIKNCIQDFKSLDEINKNKFIEFVKNLTLLSILYIKK